MRSASLEATLQEDRHNNFDIVRLFAAFQVLEVHTAGTFLPPPWWVQFLLDQLPGVPIFFIVSGFLVTISFRHGTGGTAAYFARRALRIYPGLWVNIAVILLLLAASHSLSPDISAWRIAEWIAVAFVSGADTYANFAAGPIVDGAGFYPFFPSRVLWTIPVELGFYVLLPVVLLPSLLFRRYRWVLPVSLVLWTAASLAVTFAYRDLLIERPDALITKILSVTTPTYLWYFLIGVACSVYWQRIQGLLVGHFPAWLAVHLAFAGAHTWLAGAKAVDFHNITPLLPLHAITLAGAMLSFAYSWRNLSQALHGMDLSYGTYLYHIPVLLTLKFLGASPALWCWPVAIGLTFALAALSWLIVERPALRLKSVTDRWLSKGRSVKPPSDCVP